MTVRYRKINIFLRKLVTRIYSRTRDDIREGEAKLVNIKIQGSDGKVMAACMFESILYHSLKQRIDMAEVKLPTDTSSTPNAALL